MDKKFLEINQTDRQEAMEALLAVAPFADLDHARPVYHFRPPAQWMNDVHAFFYQLLNESTINGMLKRTLLQSRIMGHLAYTNCAHLPPRNRHEGPRAILDLDLGSLRINIYVYRSSQNNL